MKKNYIEKRREGGKEFSDDNRFKKKRNDSCLGEETVSWEKCVMTQVVSVANLRCRLPVVSIPQRLNRETKRRRVRQLRNDQFVFFFRLVAGADNQPDSILLTDGKILFIIHLVECRSGIPNDHRGGKAWELFFPFPILATTTHDVYLDALGAHFAYKCACVTERKRAPCA